MAALGHPTFTDPATDLMWEKLPHAGEGDSSNSRWETVPRSSGEAELTNRVAFHEQRESKNFQEAQQICSELQVAAIRGWRLPTSAELVHLHNPEARFKVVGYDYQFVPTLWIWSGTAVKDDQAAHVAVRLTSGEEGNKPNEYGHGDFESTTVLCVHEANGELQ
jgi:hypothetical protein